MSELWSFDVRPSVQSKLGFFRKHNFASFKGAYAPSLLAAQKFNFGPPTL